MSVLPTNTSATTTIRFTSIEPLSEINERLENIAKDNGCELEFQSSTVVNAPFCGVDYHVEIVGISRIAETESIASVESCIEAIQYLQTEEFADGFIEVIE